MDLPVAQLYKLTIARLARYTTVLFARHKQRLMALFLIVIILFGASSQTAFAISINTLLKPQQTGSNTNSNATQTGKGPHLITPKTSTKPSIGVINYKSPSDLPIKKSKNIAAVGASSQSNSTAVSFLSNVKGKVNEEPMAPTVGHKLTITPHELISDRTATSTEYLNKDGSVTKTNYLTPHFYKNNGAWDKIDTSLIPDDNAADSGNIVGKALGAVESWVSSTNAYQVKANSWNARFTPSNFGGGMIRIKQGNSQMGFSPINANTVNPSITTDSNGQQIVHYYNLWNGVDVEYLVESDQLKEAIELKDKSSATQIQFKMVGATLKKTQANGSSKVIEPAFNIVGALNNQFNIAPSSLFLNNFGPVTNETSGLTQTYQNGKLTIGVNNTYLQKLPNKAFPAVIDPSVILGPRSGVGAEYQSYETNGEICPPTQCDPYAGSLKDSNNVQQYWRSTFHVNYSQFFQNTGNKLNTATLHLSQRSGVSWWTGYTGTYTYYVGPATCENNYACWNGYTDSGSVGTSGDISVTDIYQSWINSGNWNGYLMLDGYNGSTLNWKCFDPEYSDVSFTYTNPLPAPSFSVPQNGQVFADPQASFSVATESNPNNGTPLQYSFQITDGSNGNGTIINSGTTYLSSTNWTVPDGVLQDGSTYFIEASSYDPSTQLQSPWSSPVRFKVDMREGQDKTQTHGTFGPASVDFATGNLETSISSHSSKALGGNLGVSLDYNSPLRSRPGLVGSYWNASGTGSASSPDLQRVDQNIDFNWNGNSPGPGITSGSNFNAQWDGYFVAPASGTYYFGYVNSGYVDINLNGSSYVGGNCTSAPPNPTYCYGTGVTLTAGQAEPIQVQYNQSTGSDYVHIYVKGAVSEQVIPTAWLQTGARQINQSQGLIGHYYTYTDSINPPTFPSNGTDGLFMTRTDPVISFDWNSGPPIANGPSSDFMVRWTGFITVPATASYTFGTKSDDGSDITINNQSIYSKWQDSPGTTGFGTPIALTAGQPYPITIDYYQHGGDDYMSLLMQNSDGSNVVLPSSWLSPEAQVLPNGWNIGLSSDGSITYSHLTINQNNAILSDAAGNTYDYTWNGNGGYTPPAGSYGSLIRNGDGSFTLQDSDGKTYNFDSSGTLSSVTSATDDTNPAALKYVYGPINTTGPVALQQITDGVNSNRYIKLYYSDMVGGVEQTQQCGSAPSNFNLAPSNMLCAAQTNDGRTTYFYYDASGNLGEVSKPGNADTIYEYEEVDNAAGQVSGYRIWGIRSDLANDAVLAGERSDSDNYTLTNIGYDSLGRVNDVTTPSPDSSDTNYLEYQFDYNSGSTEEHQVGATEPAGYTEKAEYDNFFRTTRVYDNQGLATVYTWDPVKDLLYATTNPEGLMSTTIYDDEDRPVGQYGPAPASEFNTWSWTLANTQGLTEGQSLYSPDHRFQFIFQTDGNLVLYGPSGALWASGTGGQAATNVSMQSDGNLVIYNGGTAIWASNTTWAGSTSYLVVQNDGIVQMYNSAGPVWSAGQGGWGSSPTQGGYGTPLSAYVNQIAHSDMAYDQGMTGLSVAYMQINPSTDNESLVDAPISHSLNIASDGTISHDWGSTAPVSTSNGDWGFSMTGSMRLPSTGNWSFNVTADEGIKMWIDDQLVLNDWKENQYWSGNTQQYPNPTNTFSYTYNNTIADSYHTVRIDYYHLTASSDATFALQMTPPGGSQTSQVAQYYSPDYGLATSTTTYDSTYGNTTVDTNYGNSPYLGEVTSTAADPNGLNLTNTTAYESPGTGYLRPSSQTSAGGSTTTYSYYGANDTLSNPCVAGSQAEYQAGMLKTVTNPSPDGGTTTGESNTVVYDAAGNVVASETNNDGWECKSYDARGRITEDDIPAYNGNTARSVTYNYAVNGNPLVTSVTDSQGTVTTTVDLLGRTVSYINNLGDTTNTTYDGLGRVSSRSSAMGTENYTYDNYNRLTDEQLNGVDLAKPTYDQYGRLQSTTYPSAGTMNESTGYDANTGAQNAVTYNLNGTALGANSVPNTSVEQSTNGTTPDQWTTGNWGTNTASFSYSTDAHTGTHSVRTDMTSYTSGDAKWYFNSVNVSPNTSYTFSDYYKSNVSTSIIVQITNQDNSLTYISLGDPAASSTSWAQNTYTFTTPSTAASATVFHLIQAVGWLEEDDTSLEMNNAPISVSDNETLTQSGMVQSDVIASGASSLASDYTYDAADRLTNATIGSNSYAYGFGTQDASCGPGSNMNPNSGKNGNRTTQTINGVTTTYCYNYADQLVSSSDPTASGTQYDSHGNMTQIGTTSAPVQFGYDSSDRNSSVVQTDGNGNGNGLYYSRDADNRITYREHDTITNWTWNMDAQYFLGYTDNTDSPSYVYDSSWNLIDEYVALPGGVLVTIHPQKSSQTDKYSYNLSNIHGDTLLTTDGTGTSTTTGNGPADTYAYDPFGNPLPGGQDPQNIEHGSLGWKGLSEKISETDISLNPIQMGARVYLPTIGRFTSLDPVPGGNVNDYAYPPDPINESDLTGEFSFFGTLETIKNATFAVIRFMGTLTSIIHARNATNSNRANSPSNKAKSVSISNANSYTAHAPVRNTSFVSKTYHSTVHYSLDAVKFVANPIGTITSSPVFQGAAIGCAGGMLGVSGPALATALAGGQVEISAGEYVWACDIGGTTGAGDAIRNGGGNLMDTFDKAKGAYDVYTSGF